MAASSNNLRYWEMSQGGSSGVFMDASVSTAVVTGLQCGRITVVSTAIFTTLLGADVRQALGIDFRITNGISGIAVGPCDIWPGYARHFTAVAISQGQIQRYEKRDN